ncbi:MAG TPA: ABC transporter permease, partial [Gemmatimonadaceae bacterium]|nr:ABC transporter permease [Gemmatimonadaceae bacterium]
IFVPATTGFAEALGLRLTRGRWFAPGDALDGGRVAVVSRTLAERAFPHTDPIGQRILISGDTWRIVGVAADAPYEGVGSPLEPVVYVPFANRPSAGVWIAVKTPGSPTALVKAIRDAVHSVDPEMSVRDPRPLADMVSDSVVRPRFQTFLITTFGAVALCLALVGIYGVVAYGVAQRTAEIGLRLALGSTRGGVIALVVRGGMAPVIAGVGVGLVVALALSRALSTMVYGVATTDGATYAVVSGALLAAAAAAVYVPARRASRTDPGLAMR